MTSTMSEQQIASPVEQEPPDPLPRPPPRKPSAKDENRFKITETLGCFFFLLALCYLCLLYGRIPRAQYAAEGELDSSEKLVGTVATRDVFAERGFYYSPTALEKDKKDSGDDDDSATPPGADTGAVAPTREPPADLIQVFPDEIIVRKGSVISDETARKLQAHNLSIRQHNRINRRLLPVYQATLLCALLLLCFGLGIHNLKPDFFHRSQRIVLGSLCAALHLSLLVAGQWLHDNVFFGNSLHLYALIPLALAPALAAYLMGMRIGLCLTLLLSALTALLLPSNHPFLLGINCFLIAMVGLLLFHNVNKRYRFAWGGLGVAAAVFAFSLFFAWYQDMPWLWSGLSNYGPKLLALALLNGLVVVVALFLLPSILERIFDVTTPSSLGELNDRDHPLLERLRKEAPGTYEHSLNVARLATDAAKAIGANPALAEVCAYFHDVGKLCAPEYFAENQLGDMPNPHDQLSPEESCSILRAHVRHGIELARKYRLNRPIREAIAQHHGDSVIAYFFQRAEQLAKKSGGKAPDIADYRYDGPRPHRPEVVIVKIADTCEAAMRALFSNQGSSKIGGARIGERVNELLFAKMQAHQFDASSLTVADFMKIRDQIVQTLCNIYHERPEYPPKEETAPATPAAPAVNETQKRPTTPVAPVTPVEPESTAANGPPMETP
jgi:putative nucleotidyltransferase with HDIG domain